MTLEVHHTQSLMFQIDRRSTTASTMDDVARKADSAPEGYVVVADYQREGIGRGGRSWISEPGNGLLFSVLLKPTVHPSNLPVLSLMTAVSVATSVESLAGVRTQVKWPNDVLINGMKVAGVLLKSRIFGSVVDYVIIGIGVNVKEAPRVDDLRATSLWTESRTSIDRDALLHDILDRLAVVFDDFCRDETSGWLDMWLDRAWLRGATISVRSNGETHVGVFTGVDHFGGLLLRGPEGSVTTVRSGEVRTDLQPADSSS